MDQWFEDPNVQEGLRDLHRALQANDHSKDASEKATALHDEQARSNQLLTAIATWLKVLVDDFERRKTLPRCPVCGQHIELHYLKCCHCHSDLLWYVDTPVDPSGVKRKQRQLEAVKEWGKRDAEKALRRKELEAEEARRQKEQEAMEARQLEQSLLDEEKRREAQFDNLLDEIAEKKEN